MWKSIVTFLLIRPIAVCIFLVLANIAGLAADTPVSKLGLLDGLQFRGSTGEQGKKDHHTDTIAFKDGRFRSLDCENWGFSSEPYSVKKDGDSYHFVATLFSDDRGRLEWKGVITGDAAEADFRWIHKRWYWNIDRHYWFKGKQQTDQ